MVHCNGFLSLFGVSFKVSFQGSFRGVGSLLLAHKRQGLRLRLPDSEFGFVQEFSDMGGAVGFWGHARVHTYTQQYIARYIHT